MIEELKALEEKARLLEPDALQREHLRNAVVQYTEDFLSRNENEGAYEKSPELSESVSSEIFEEHSEDIDLIMERLPDQIDRDGINPASGFHLGYIPGGGLYTSSLGDYWSDITNRYTGIYFANPGAVRLENRLIRWMAGLVGYPSSTFGNLASGGSIANLTAIVTAREAKGVTPGLVEKSVIYLSKQIHHCLLKAIKIAGLETAQIRYVSLDSRYRMNTTHLEDLIKEDINKGYQPFMVMASAGTTDVGAVDPLRRIGEISREYKMWYHIDGAYGAFFTLTDEGRRKLDGIESSDSLVLDPHKGLFLPYGLGVVLVRDGMLMKRAFTQSANYMQDAEEVIEEVSPADVSIELTKPFRGLRMWLPLKLHGVAPFRAALQEKMLLARYFYQKVQSIPGFKVGPDPDLSVVVFWYSPPDGDENAFNQRLVQEIHRDGRVFLSSTMLEDRFVLRLAVLVFRTHLDIIDLTLKILTEKVSVIEER